MNRKLYVVHVEDPFGQTIKRPLKVGAVTEMQAERKTHALMEAAGYEAGEYFIVSIDEHIKEVMTNET